MFVWDPRPASKQLTKHHAERRIEMYRRELGDRAALLYRLGYSAAHAKTRLKAEVAWDFEMTGAAKHQTEVDKIVDGVYKRGGTTFGSPSV